MSAKLEPGLIAEIDYPESDGEPVAETDLHLDELLALRDTLQARYRAQADVYVGANLFVYYDEGNPSARVAPDVFVVFSVPKRQRRVYKLWEEQRVPDVVFEISSRATRLADTGEKRALYARLGVSEYFLFDPEGDYLRPHLQGFALERGAYELISVDGAGRLYSAKLDLYLEAEGQQLTLTDAATGKPLLRYQQLSDALHASEAEIARLQEELERLRRERGE